jgi:hypothetical protein
VATFADSNIVEETSVGGVGHGDDFCQVLHEAVVGVEVSS